MTSNKTEKQIFWDYNLDKADLKNPKVKPWYLTRKLQLITGIYAENLYSMSRRQSQSGIQ